MLLRKIGFMQNKSLGFALIELIIVILILGIVGGTVIPRLRYNRPQDDRKKLYEDVNELTQLAWQNAMQTRKIHKVIMDFKKRLAWVESLEDREKGEPKVVPSIDKVSWPGGLEVVEFFINGEDELRHHHGHKNADDAWFFIVPDGLCQSVIINIIDPRENDDDPAHMSFVLNPFLAQFEMYDEFKSP